MKLTPLEYFELWSQRELSNKERMNARRNLLNVRRAVGRDLNVYPEKKIEVFFTESKVFREYTKSPDHVSGLFDGKIHLTTIEEGQTDKELKSILWHEYTHALVWMISEGQCPAWLNEGLAVYEEETIDPKRSKGLKKIVIKDDRLVIPIGSLESIIGNFRSSNLDQLAAAYMESYAIADYLIDRYSPAVIKDLLKDTARTKDFEKSLKSKMNMNLPRLEERVVRHIKRL